MDDFKNSEAANKVTSLYDKRIVELQSLFEVKAGEKPAANRDLSSFYAHLHVQDFKDTAKRLLLD